MSAVRGIVRFIAMTLYRVADADYHVVSVLAQLYGRVCVQAVGQTLCQHQQHLDST
jgi:hypothetical protein